MSPPTRLFASTSPGTKRSFASTPGAADAAALSIRLSAAIVAASVDEPRVLTLRIGRDKAEALPSGPLEAEHRTLEVGLRAWVERQTGQKLGYVYFEDEPGRRSAKLLSKDEASPSCRSFYADGLIA